MTNQHPITPPPELVREWLGTYFGTTLTGEVSKVELALATQAARWGGDQELDACCAEVSFYEGKNLQVKLRAARRPKPPSLKEQALTAMLHLQKAAETSMDTIEAVHIICRALEALPND
jgi:hypothetical protein